MSQKHPDEQGANGSQVVQAHMGTNGFRTGFGSLPCRNISIGILSAFSRKWPRGCIVCRRSCRRGKPHSRQHASAIFVLLACISQLCVSDAGNEAEGPEVAKAGRLTGTAGHPHRPGQSPHALKPRSCKLKRSCKKRRRSIPLYQSLEA